MLVDLSHTIEHGMITYAGLPPPAISDYLTREASRSRYAAGTEFHIGRIDMVANTGTYLDTPSHRFADGSDVSMVPLDAVAGIPALLLRAKGRSRKNQSRHATTNTCSTRRWSALFQPRRWTMRA